MSEKLRLDEAQRKLIRLAALLHDLGHGPFSHVSEEALELYSDNAKLPVKADKIHEAITAKLIQEDKNICAHTSPADRENVVRVLSVGHGEPIVKAILSGPLDADKQDYLLRDSYFCGVQYGVFDLARLHDVLFCHKNDTGDQLAVRQDGVHALEQFVLAKYYETTQIIRHRIRLITDQMLIRAITLGIDKDEIQELRDLYSYDGTWAFINRYTAWDDARLLYTFSDEQFLGKLSFYMFSGLRNRRLLKLVFKEDIKEFAAVARPALSKISKQENRALRSRIENEVAEIIWQHAQHDEAYSCDHRNAFVIAHAYTLKNVKEQARNDEASILIEGTPPKPFEQASSLFSSIDEKLNETSFEIYAPVHYHTPADRRKLRQNLRAPILQVLERVAKGEPDANC